MGLSEPHEPRHARVLPSFFLAYLKGSLDTSAGRIDVHELLYWTRQGLLTESLAQEMRLIGLRRLRTSRPAVFDKPVNVTCNAVPTSLSVDDATLLRRILAAFPDRKLDQLSLNELRAVAKTGFPRILGLLAKAEAAYWIPQAPVRGRILIEENLPANEPMTESLRALVSESLRLPWIDDVRRGDPRLSGSGGLAPAPWLREMLNASVVPGTVRDLASRLLAADRMPYDQEVADLARSALMIVKARPSAERVSKWQAIFSSRYACLERPRTLQEVGDQFGLTRERIRQMCDLLLSSLRDGPLCTPSLDRVIRMATRAAPCSIAEADALLRKQLGEAAGLLSALEFAQALGTGDIHVQMSKVKVRMSGKYEHAPILEPIGEQRWAQRLLSYAAAECTTIGCTNVLRMAGRLALQDGVALSQEALESAVAVAPGFVWLDRDNGWFSVGSTVGSGAATRLRKILAVATEPVSVDEVAEAFACDTRWFRDDDRSLAIPPTFVIQAMAKTWPFVRTTQYTRFAATDPISVDEVLTDIERLVLSIIQRSDGIAPAWHLYEACTEQLRVTRMAVAVALSSSPILVRFEFGLYALRGCRIKDGALARARADLAKKTSRNSGTGGDPDVFRVTVTQACMTSRNEQYRVPSRLLSRVAGRNFPIVGLQPCDLRFSAGGAMRGIRQAFPSAKPGQVLEIRLLDNEATVELIPNASPADQP